MTDHQHRTIDRHADVAVIGGSSAALQAALRLGRQDRSVIVIDASQGDGPDRAEARRHGIEVLAGRATNLARTDRGHRVELVGGHTVVAAQVLADPDEPVVTTAAAERHPAGDLVAFGTDADLDATPTSAQQADWDHRYSASPMWSGNPNGTLVNQTTGLAPGRALDVGAGEGGDAVWLAEQGWQVTANDISPRALARIAAAAAERGLDIACLHADANAPQAFPDGGFDLVSAQYASIPRTTDGRGVANLLGAVAPGGTLLVVSHDLAPMRGPVDTATTSRPFDPDAYVRVEDVVAALAERPGWVIEQHATVPRPPGATAAAAHHVDDVLLRARR